MKPLVCGLLLVSACTYLEVTVDPPPQTQCLPQDDPNPNAIVVYAVRLSRRFVSLAPAFDALRARVEGTITAHLVNVSHSVLVPLVYEDEIRDPLFAESCEHPAGGSMGEALRDAAAPLTTSDESACELQPLADIAQNFALMTPLFSSEPASATATPLFFDRDARYLLVVIVDPEARAHGHGDCSIAQRSPAAFFATQEWTDVMPLDRTFFLSIATHESDEGPAAFAQECLDMEGFPKAAIDALEPSKQRFFTDFTRVYNELRPGGASSVEMCEALSNGGAKKIDEVIRDVHASVGLFW